MPDKNLERYLRMSRVLVIEDNDDFRALLQIALEAEGFGVVTASNGEHGLRLLAQAPTDVVITDIFMPGKEGIETIAELRKQFPGVRIIAMSGRPSATDFDPLSVAMELGAAKILRKPFDLDELIESVKMLAPKPRPRPD
jgi:DNA-binding response OmpR family regulator